ncbi:MAG: MucR family transcriptional regulator [Magnetococcales bacterium]|nr:MucR family transcriptional regulator [Magnetococcales bacterium]
MSLIPYTTEIVKAYLSRNEVALQQLPALIETVHHALLALADEDPLYTATDLFQGPLPVESEPPPSPVPFVPVEQAVTEDSVICLICGKASKAIKGHLTKTHHMDIPTYLANFGLPKDFPMVAPSYSATRRQLAIAAGAGEKLQAGRERKREA